MQLCDTNVLSELARPEPNPGALAWADGVPTIALSVITLDELYFGLAWRPIPKISAWLEDFLESCQVLPLTTEIARVSGHLRGTLRARGIQRTQADMMIAATAKVHGLTVVTRNVQDFEGCGVPVLDPFS